MVGLFGHCSNELIRNLDKAAASGEVVDMEERFCSVSLDIIGLAVFNYDFGSVTKESPIIQRRVQLLARGGASQHVLFAVLELALRRRIVVPRQREFKENMGIINDTLNGLIKKAQQFEGTEDLEELQNRDYSKVKDPSLLRFLVDIRGADVTDAQLRDDLMTMLIAGHETTAAVLTWGLFCLVQKPELMKRIQADIDEVFGDDDRTPTYDDIQKLESVRLCIAEALASLPRATNSHSSLPRGRHLAQGRGRRRGDPHQGDGHFHQRVEPAPLSRVLGEPRRIRPVPIQAPLHQPRRQGLGRIQPRFHQRPLPQRDRL